MAEDPPPVEDRRLELSDLPDDMLMEIFARLPANKLLSVERVSRTWKRCVGPVLNRVEVIVFNFDKNTPEEPIGNYLQLNYDNRPTLFINFNKFIKNPINTYKDINEFYSERIDSISQLVIRCPNVKCLDLSRVQNAKNECLIKLTAVMPELEYLNVGKISDGAKRVNHVKWGRLPVKRLPKLAYLEICPCFIVSQDHLNFLLAGEKLRSVHLFCCYDDLRYPLPVKTMLDKLKSQLSQRPGVELSMDFDWLKSGCYFNDFDHLEFVFKRMTRASRSIFEIIDWKKPQELKIGKFSSERIFLHNLLIDKVLIVFKTLECLEMHNVELGDNLLKCRFERLETVKLINTRATDDAAFSKLFGSMKEQVKKLVIRINDWQPTHQYFPSKSLTVLKRLEKLEIEIDIKHKEQIRMTELFDALMNISPLTSHQSIKVIFQFQQYLVVPRELKKALAFKIRTLNWSLPSNKILVELRFNKQEFDGDFAMDEVMDWYFSACHFEQISERYTEEEDFHKVEITTSESRMSIKNVDVVVTNIDNLNIHNLEL